MSDIEIQAQTLKREQVMKYCNISNGQLYDDMAKGTFPEPRHRSGRFVRWYIKDLDLWNKGLWPPQKEPATVAA